MNSAIPTDSGLTPAESALIAHYERGEITLAQLNADLLALQNEPAPEETPDEIARRLGYDRS